MARYRLVQEDSGCCNLVLWDFLLTLAAVGVSAYYGSHKAIHPAICFVIGLVAAVVMIALMNIRVLGKILQMLLSAFWAFVAMSLIVSWFHPDTLWQVVIFAVLLLVFIGLHVVSADEMGIGPSVSRTEPVIFEEPASPSVQSVQADADVAQMVRRYETLQRQRDAVMKKALQLLQVSEDRKLQTVFEENNRVWKEGSEKLEELAGKLEHAASLPELYRTIGVIGEYLDKMGASNDAVMQQVLSSRSPAQQQSAPSGFDPFAGCDTLEKLEQRYRQLAKSFHPDTGNGDTQSMQYINAEYERRKEQLRR